MADELTSAELERLADEIRPPRPRGSRTHHVEQPVNESKVRTGRPPRLSHADEWELYCYRKTGIAIKTCASMFRVSVPTANRIIAKFRHLDESAEPLAREFRDKLDALRDST